MSAHSSSLKDGLAHTWDAFFARFGRFTEIQAQAIEPVLEGKNCVLVSATASGKTEAAVAPLLERHVLMQRREQGGPGLLYIVPTRALARDLARRLAGPLDQLAVRMQVKTGDEPGLTSARLPQLLITTPESFDSLLAGHPRMAKDVRAVILDEIHLLDNSPRGDQLRILLNRLRRIRRNAFERGDAQSEAIQFCALSATVHDPAGVAARYFSLPLVLQVATQRALDAELIAMDGDESLAALFAGLQRRGRRKLLVFCSRRAECEHWAGNFRNRSPFGDRIFVHHASLDVRVRREVERNFAVAESAVCFATSTLELGIDIGDVDLIVLAGPPPDTGGFLQRIGRGNRRTARTAVVCFYRNEIERALFQVFVGRALTGTMEPDGYFFRPSVVPQQLFSYIKQTRFGEIVPDAAYGLFASPTGEPLIQKNTYDRIVDHLIVEGYFVARQGGVLRPGPKWRELYEKRAIYSNLTDSRQAVAVVDEMTGRKLGEIGWGIKPGMTFRLGGRMLLAVHLNQRKLLVRPSQRDAERETPRRRTPYRPLSPTQARAAAIEMRLPGAESPARLTMARVTEDTDTIQEGQTQTGEVCLFHYAGDAYGRVLGDLLEARYNVRVRDYNGLCLMLQGTPPAAPLRFSDEQVREHLDRHWQQFESWYDLGCFQRHLPLEARRRAVIEAFQVDEFLRTFSGSAIVESA